MDPRNTDALRQRMNRRFEVFGTLLTDGFHYVALLAIGAAIFWSAGVAFLGMVRGYAFHRGPCRSSSIWSWRPWWPSVSGRPHAGAVPDLRGITGLTRMLVADIQAHHRPDQGILMIAGASLVLALATLVIRYGSSRFPAAEPARRSEGRQSTKPSRARPGLLD